MPVLPVHDLDVGQQVGNEPAHAYPNSIMSMPLVSHLALGSIRAGMTESIRIDSFRADVIVIGLPRQAMLCFS